MFSLIKNGCQQPHRPGRLASASALSPVAYPKQRLPRTAIARTRRPSSYPPTNALRRTPIPAPTRTLTLPWLGDPHRPARQDHHTPPSTPTTPRRSQGRQAQRYPLRWRLSGIKIQQRKGEWEKISIKHKTNCKEKR